jgi:hypothetical protein
MCKIYDTQKLSRRREAKKEREKSFPLFASKRNNGKLNDEEERRQE